MLENDISAKVGLGVPASFLREPAVGMDCHAAKWKAVDAYGA